MAAPSTLRSAWRNYSTLFLLAATVTVPLHIALSFAARRVIEVYELHAEIATWGADRELAGIGAADLGWYRRGVFLVSVAEVLLLPWLIRAGRRVLDVDRLGGLPSIARALKPGHTEASGLEHTSARYTLFPIVAGIIIWILAHRIGRILSDFLPADMRWAGWGLFDALAISTAAPLVLTALAHTSLLRSSSYKPAKRSVSGKSVGTRDETRV